MSGVFNRIGFGCWQLAGAQTVAGRPNGWGSVEPELAHRALLHAIDSGVRFFDTADAYGRGRSERRLGEALRQRMQCPTQVCSKVGNRVDASGRQAQDFSPRWVREATQQSAQRLGRDRIDYLLLHSPPLDFVVSDALRSTLTDMQTQGLIGDWGISARTATAAGQFVDCEQSRACQVLYNALDPRASQQVFARQHRDQGKGFWIARVPLASGFLTARGVRGEMRFSEDDRRSALPADDLSWLSMAARCLAFLDQLPGGIAVSALRFCLSANEVDVVLPGMHKPEHVDHALLAAELGPLPAEVLDEIANARPDLPQSWCYA